MKPSLNTLEARKKKTEWIRERFPQIDNIDPYLNNRFVIDVKNALIESEFYAKTKHVEECTVLNLILEAQGKRFKRNQMRWK